MVTRSPLALLPLFLIERELAERRLIPAFGAPIKSLGSYYLVWPKDSTPRPQLGAFRDWIGGQVEQAAGKSKVKTSAMDEAVIGTEMAAALGQRFVVNNLPAAGGVAG